MFYQLFLLLAFVVLFVRFDKQKSDPKECLRIHFLDLLNNFLSSWVVVVAQLVGRLLLTPEVRGSNSVIGKNYITYILSIVLIRRK